MMTQDASAPELLNDFLCECSDNCINSCVCSKNSQPCAPACGCGVDIPGLEDEGACCNNPCTALTAQNEPDDSDSD